MSFSTVQFSQYLNLGTVFSSVVYFSESVGLKVFVWLCDGVWGKGLWEFGRLLGYVSRPKWGLVFFSPTETFQLEPYESQPGSQHGRSSSADCNESLIPTVISLNALLGLLWITASTGWGGRVWGIYCMLVFIILAEMFWYVLKPTVSWSFCFYGFKKKCCLSFI